MVSSLPHANDTHVDILTGRSIDEEEDVSAVENVTNEMLGRDLNGQREDVTTAGGKSRLVIPSSFFKKPKYHPLEIFVSYPFLSHVIILSKSHQFLCNTLNLI